MEIKKVELLNKEGLEKFLSIGSGCVIINENRVLLVRGIGGDQFKFPGGHIDDSENFKQSAQRECQEEIGCKVETIGDPAFFLFKADADLSIVLVHYKAKITEGDPKPTTEIEEVQWFDISKLPINIFENVKPVIDFFKKEII